MAGTDVPNTDVGGRRSGAARDRSDRNTNIHAGASILLGIDPCFRVATMAGPEGPDLGSLRHHAVRRSFFLPSASS